jgi:uncharacterized protein YcbX
MLCKVLQDDNGGRKLKNMHVVHVPEMSLFLTKLVVPSDIERRDGKIIVTYQTPPVSEGKGRTKIEVPLQPDIDDLEEVDIVMHSTSTTGYDMGSHYNDWFSENFGYPVMLVYIGHNRRRVLGSMAPHAWETAGGGGGWLSSITSNIPYLGKKEDEGIITFADCAAYLVISETSRQDVSSRFAEGFEVDVTKFRPNIVVSGAETAWEEDYWGELTVGDAEKAKIMLTSNCVRCMSLNVNYDTGTIDTDGMGQVFKKLTKDRRVDKGAKYSPVFGRYGFLKGNDSILVRVGDPVEVSRTLTERTTFGKCRLYT